MNDYLQVSAFISKDVARNLATQLEQEKDEGETAKHRHLVAEYIKPGMNGVDLGSAGVPVVPWAIQVDLPPAEYQAYNPVRGDAGIHWRGSALDLPFKDSTLDFVHASHILEDFEEWDTPLREWHRVLTGDGGILAIAIPDHTRFRAAVERGQGDNLSHRSETLCAPGAISEWLARNMASQKYEVLHDDFINDSPDEYSVLFIGRRLF